MELLKNLEGLSADEQMSAVVELQKAAMKHLEEQKQASIGKSAEMVILGLKKIKSDFEAKFDSLNYDIQTKIANLKDGEQGLQGPKGEQGDRGLDGAQGKDGKSGVDGKDGLDGKDGVSVQDAKIDFDGSLVITLSDGREINCGEVVSVDVAKQIQKVTHNIQTGAGGDSQTVLDAIAAIQATIATYGTMATQNANNVAITGGAINNTTVGATTPSTGVFTTLTANTSVTTPIVGAATGSSTTGLDLNVNSKAQARIVEIGDGTRPLVINGGSAGGAQTAGITATTVLAISGGGGNPIRFYTNGRVTTQQLEVAHTASAVNYVQVTGAATGNNPTISMQGSDVGIGLTIQSKSANSIILQNGAAQRQLVIDGTKTGINYLQVASAATTLGPVLSSIGSDTNIPLVLQPKGTGALQAQQTDSTATGGNARGANAVDFQTSRNAASQVASGASAFIGAGRQNVSSGQDSFVGAGFQNTSSSSQCGVVAGARNQATGGSNFIGSGNDNIANFAYGTVVGGQSNTASGYFGFVGNGLTNSTTSNSAVTTQSGTMNGTTAVTLSASNANIKVGQLITGTSITFPTTYVAAISGTSLTLSQAASGSSTSTLSFFTPHGVVVGGGNNQATGSYSFIGGGGDAGTAGNRNVASGAWSVVAGGQRNVASGVGSFIGGGGTTNGNTASGENSVICGGGLFGVQTASGPGAFVGGGWANNSTGAGAVCLGIGGIANGDYSSTLGGAYGTARGIAGNTVFNASNAPLGTAFTNQAALLILARQTTDATATVLTSNTGAASTNNQVILPNNSAYAFRGTVIANVTGGGNTKAWSIEGAIKRGANAASTALVGTPTVTSAYADVGAATWAITATADTTNGGLAITFTGQAGTTIRVVAKLETTEVTF